MTHSSVDITASVTRNVLYVTLCKGWYYCWRRLVTLEQVTISDVLHYQGEFKFVLRDFRIEIWMDWQKTIYFSLSFTHQRDNVEEHYEQIQRHKMSTSNRSVSLVCAGNDCWWLDILTANNSLVIRARKSLWRHQRTFREGRVPWQDEERFCTGHSFIAAHREQMYTVSQK
jgi:hypothetical protein